MFLFTLCTSAFTIYKTLLMYVKPFFFIGIRMIVAGGLLLAYSYWKDRNVFKINKSNCWLFVQIIFFHVYCAFILDLWAMQYIKSSQSSFIYNLSPCLAALFSYFCFSEKMTSKKWLGLLIGFLGFLPELFLNGSLALNMHSLIPSWPEVVELGAVASGIYGWITVRKLVKDQKYSPMMVNGVGMVGGGILAMITSFWVEGWSVSPIMNFWPFLKIAALIILAGNIIFYNLYGFLLKRYTVTFLSFAGFIVRLFVALFGWFFLDNVLHWSFFVTVLFVFIGLYIFYQEELKQGYIV